ncbi:ribonuclease H domain protein [Bacteroidales bacterium KA00344]|nr:ribonuclease H domain protein [Bacteroidales bacterium KA00344]
MNDKNKPPIPETENDVSQELLKQYAEENKLFMTDAERLLWNLLRGKGVGEQFKRQQIIGDYIVDFVNPRYKLVVEIDGKFHFKGDHPVAEAVRTEDLNRMGYTVVRFTEQEVFGNIKRVGYQLKDVIQHMKISFPKPSQQSAPSPSAAGEHKQGTSKKSSQFPIQKEGVNSNAWAVDAACSGNPGPMEYQCIDLTTGAQIFHFGPVHGTNNIGEFLAIVHALALMNKQGIKDKVIYSDSYNAILWVKKKHCKTKLERNTQTEQLYQVIARAEQWLRAHPVQIPIIKWETKQWGEIPADFGNK